MKKTLTYGTLPDFQDFGFAFLSECPTGRFRIKHGSREEEKPIKSGNYSLGQLWKELERLCSLPMTFEEHGPDMWASCILASLGFEWV